MWFFRSPTIVFGEDALLHIAELRGERAFVVTDANVRKAHLVDPVLIQLEHAGMTTHVYDAVDAEPDEACIRAGAAGMTKFDPDWIVAVGGGSVMDAAKAMWVLYENPNIELTAVSPLDPITLRERARLIAIPTTAGTGSEATYAFVISVPADGDQPARKLGLGHPDCTPDYAIVDPTMTATLPAQVTADTGMDALTQAIEGYTATWNNEFTDGLCLVAIQQLFEFLPKAWADGDMISRERVANAATLAGLAYINSMVGAAHSMAHAAGAVLGLPHGRVCGLFLPYVIEFSCNAKRAEEVTTRYADIERFLGASAQDEAQAGAQLAARVRALAQQLEQPLSLSRAGVRSQDFLAALPALVDNAMSDTVLFTSPRQPGEAEMRRLFECAYSEQTVSF